MSATLYPVSTTGLSCADYTVTVDGVAAPLNTARESAVPFNRRWPGYQRAIDQTGLHNFLSLEVDGPTEFAVTPTAPFDPDKVVIRPRSLGITPKIENGTIRFTLPKAAYCTVEAYGRQKALHIFADGPAVHTPKEGDLYFGPGEHEAGIIEMTPGQTIFIDAGAVVYGRIHAIDCDNIKIVGRGILDCSRIKEKIFFEVHQELTHAAVRNAERYRPIQLEYCDHAQIEGITIRDSLVYNIHPRCCRDLHIHNVKLIGNWRYNSDGIDMHNCEDVLIENCFLRTFDDCLCVKGMDCFYEGDLDKAVYEATHRNGQVYEVFKNITVRNCVLWNDWGKCLEIGAETRAEEISNVLFTDCDIIHVCGPVLDCCNMDYADIHDVVYQNINVEYDDIIEKPVIQRSDAQIYENPDPDYAPPLLKVYIQFHYEYSAGGTRRGRCHDITFRNIHLWGRQTPRIDMEGYDAEHPVENITIENLHHNGKLISSFAETDYRPNEFTGAITYTANPYAQMDKNTVDAANQLHGAGPVRFLNPAGRGKRVMFIGNSMTLHGINESLGWQRECGMAASAPDKDYVHILADRLGKENAYCICQVSGWEQQYKTGSELLERFQEARDFGADVLVMRFVENCPKDGFDPAVFKAEAARLLTYLNPKGGKLVLTTGFWRHPGDEAIRQLYKELSAVGADAHIDPSSVALVELGDLGELDEMKAIGRFSHKGVANHPGDAGMAAMASRIYDAITYEVIL